MIHGAVQRAIAMAIANFAVDLAAVCAAKAPAVAAPAGAWQIVEWQDAEIAVRLGSAKPILGITLGPNALTQAKDQGKRDSTVAVLFDVYIEGADPTLLAQQIAIAPEAVMLTVDRLAGGGGVEGAAQEERSVSVELTDGYEERGDQSNYWQRARVLVPVTHRDAA
jgi:hypothetical protein